MRNLVRRVYLIKNTFNKHLFIRSFNKKYIQYKDVNIELRVTPHVSENKKIIMSVNPVIEEVTGEVVVDVNRAPITSKRAVHTTVSVKDGETIVIGGMIKDNTTVTTNKVFLLGDIPLIGPFFRHQKKEKKQTDLMIFITPHIVEAE